MTVTILTLFPEMFAGPFDASILKRAQEKGAIQLNMVNFREYGMGLHKTVDDTPYGGGKGMIIRVDVAVAAISAVAPGYKILLTPQGNTFNDASARRLARESHLILFCGHYEGVDDRVRHFVDDEISIGDYVLTGGELPAMVVVDAVARHVPGVLSPEAAEDESFAKGLLEYPHYTRPSTFRGHTVPNILTSGDHAAIKKWREQQARQRTRKRRKDLLTDK